MEEENKEVKEGRKQGSTCRVRGEEKRKDGKGEDNEGMRKW